MSAAPVGRLRPRPLRRRPPSAPAVRVAHLVVDTADLDRAVAFWSALLELPISAHGDGWADLAPLGFDGPVLAFQAVPEVKAGKNRLHLDLAVDDVEAAGDYAMWLGATAVSPVQGTPGRTWQVWRDPEGNEFCFLTA
jgi:predicted enzyme related to lactoylglutathione lyase